MTPLNGYAALVLPPESRPEPSAKGETGLLPLLLDARKAAALCGRSVASWHRDNASGRCPAPVRIGGSVRWRRADLEAWVAAGCPERATWEALARGRK